MSVLKDHYSQYTSEYLLKRRTLGVDLSDEAHSAIERIFEERGESLPPRTEELGLNPSHTRTLLQLARALMGRVGAFLGTPRLPLWKYCVIAAPLALIPSVAVLSIAMFASRLLGVAPRLPFHPPMTPVWTFVMVVATPVAETIVLAVGLWILRRLISTPFRLAAASAVLWGLLHATAAPIWFFGTAWSFFVFSSAYLAWREHSRTYAFVAAALPHMLVNLAAVAMMRAGR